MTKIQMTKTVNPRQDKRKRGRVENSKREQKTRKDDGLFLFGILSL
jgi:hypothetical protein